MSSEIILRPATRTDVPVLFDLIKALAEYEKLSDAVMGNALDLENHLFGDRPFAEAILAESEGRVVGWALFFHNYSTFLTQPGIYLEDLFVLPEFRGRGIGKSLIVYLAQLTVDRGCGRLEWSVLDWNELAIGFYKGIGANVMPDWRICRLAGESLATLASK
ncbi:MAG: GNAT family N-acetyltransferase [Oscillatoriales cyanobacterium]|uniref:GNAT family N-acetyltransferase n=1 Tax=Microcoleus anatoxicus PTRS2 TaxID=2705321 RepID=A0ABU8YLJ2_9CYAN|nr:MAG: GNAT family N-acetyltransferase [Oscillatoriales cyanobacterium]TAD96547.1 MAG: GNAT family N-acetyltransferase [Oscillatoriales cyanobacterium]TAE04948.1 MAG: GNAT family N-acetyltransferase [Oscillatoriales cyanobacterium]TAF01529.1 MAG: GNAT family N-acetyltransferase [Oscillatoriales cyanobacterium]TAF37504.1 MAG: GNAT family N-acetyltransferase [Oscillatoriales cyanobacterium]